MSAKATIPKSALPHTEADDPIAPLEAAAVVALVVDEEVVDAAATLPVVEAEVAVEAEDPVDDPPIGAVDCPAISAETDALKVPVMSAIVNRWEKANSLKWKEVELSTRVRDCIRMK